MSTHFSILAWGIPMNRGEGGLQSMGSQDLDTSERLSTHIPVAHESRWMVQVSAGKSLEF